MAHFPANRCHTSSTPAERSWTLADLAKSVKHRLLENASAQGAQGVTGYSVTATDKPHGGAPKRAVTEAKVAAEIGVSVSTLNIAQRHVTAVERYPELEAPDVSQREAVRLAGVCTPPPYAGQPPGYQWVC